MAAQYPTAAGTDANLFIAKNNLSCSLSGAHNAAVTTITVNDTTGFPTAGYITIDAEAISYTGTTGTTFTGCTRGADGTTAATHVDLSQVFHDVVAAHHNVLKDELKAVETDLVATFSAITPATATSTATSVLNRLAMFCKRFVDLNTSSSNWYDAFAWLSGLDQTATVTGTSATSLKNLLDQIAAQLKKITGETNWYTNPTKTLLQLLPLSGGTMSGAIAMGTSKITGLGNGTAAQDAVAFGQLKYLQAVQTTTVTSTTTSSSTFTAATNMTVAITPSSSSNRVKITVSCRGYITAVGATQMYVTIKRGSTELSGQTSGFAQMYSGASGSPDLITPIHFTYIDSPATTSATTYSVFFASSNNSTNVSLGAPAGVSVIIAEEIV
jgi:hypothetical protein